MPKPRTWDHRNCQAALDRIEGKLFASTVEAAAILGADVKTVIKAVDAGTIPATRLGAKRYVQAQWLREAAGVAAAAAELPATG
jgi:excisionase family DNA binding protein